MPSINHDSDTHPDVIRTSMLSNDLRVNNSNVHNEYDDGPTNYYSPTYLLSRSLGNTDTSGLVDSILARHAQGLRQSVAGASGIFWYSKFSVSRLDLKHFFNSDILSEKKRFLKSIESSFEHEQIEDGVDHYSEVLFHRAFARNGRSALTWLTDSLKTAKHANYLASMLKMIGRLGPLGSQDWRESVVKFGISHESIDVRDAAIQCVENWNDKSLLPILREHDEPDKCLAQYIRDILEGFHGQHAPGT